MSDQSELRRTVDGGGALSSLPEQERKDFAILQSGDHWHGSGEITLLIRRSDYPG